MSFTQYRSKITALCRSKWAVLLALCCLGLFLFIAKNPYSCPKRQAEPLKEILAPTPIPEISKNLSGLTWNPETGTLFAVTNRPERLYELSLQGKVLRSVTLRGFKDTEGISHIAGTLFALVEERKSVLCIFDITGDATAIEHEDALRLNLGKSGEKNKGFEGVSYDPVTRTLSTMREGKPFVRLAIPLDEQFRPGAVLSKPLPELCVKDVASLVHDPDGSLWILSEASAQIVHLDQDGSELRRFDLPIDKKTFQPEGITRTPDGLMFVVGEPNILAIYAPLDDKK